MKQKITYVILINCINATSYLNGPLVLNTSIRCSKKNTFTMLSAYFIIHETSSPEDPKFRTTSQVAILYPSKRRCHHGPFSKPLVKSSKTRRAKLKIVPNLGKKEITLRLNYCLNKVLKGTERSSPVSKQGKKFEKHPK